MRAVVQRVSRAAVRVDGAELGAIGRGLCVLLSVAPGDTAATAAHLADRVATLRIHSDSEGKMNLDAAAIGAAVLVVSQFTLHADTSRGHRPSFIGAGPPDLAATRHHARLDRTDPAADSLTTGRLTRVAVRATLETDVRGLAEFLQALAQDPAVLSADDLHVVANDPGSSDAQPERLRIEVTVRGWYLRAADASP